MSRGMRVYLIALAFVSGATVMTVEMAGQRSLAPHFGSSFYIWTNIIGIIMAALSLGYWFGGRLADRAPRIEVLLGVTAAAGALCMVVPFLVSLLGPVLVPEGTGVEFSFRIIFLGSFVTSLLLFAPPVFLLAMVTPYITKLLATSREDVGRTMGLVVALSTVGSLLGTFLPTLFLIPALGTRLTMVLAASLLVATAVGGLLAYGRTRAAKASPAFFLPLVPALLLQGLPLKPTAGMVEETESRYQYVQVRQEKDTLYLTLNEGLDTWHSVLVKGKFLTDGRYYDYFNLVPLHFDPAARPRLRICVVGSAAGSISRSLHHFFSGLFDLEIDGVEIDPAVVAMGETYFELAGEDNRNTRTYVMDGRTFLRTTNRRYDLIFVDAYSQQIYIPFYMTTLEFFRLVKSRLNPGGLVSINVCEFGETAPSLRAIRATMAEAFGRVSQIRVRYGMNFLLYAGREGRGLDEAVVRANLADPRFHTRSEANVVSDIVSYCLKARKTYDPLAGDEVLTDDHAPIEALMDRSLREVRSQLYGEKD